MSSSESASLDEQAVYQSIENHVLSRDDVPTPPPLTDEEYLELVRMCDERARKSLQDDGCPPCYPIGHSPSFLGIPDQYEPIISFWNSMPGTQDAVLSAQLEDWEKFRSHQKRIRLYYATRPFTNFEDKVRERLQRHKLEGHACLHLHLDLGQQSALGNWIEFQNYHLQKFEMMDMKKNIVDLRERLAAAQKKLEDEGVSWFEDLNEVKWLNMDLHAAEFRPRQHKILLRWIEQQRTSIATELATAEQAKLLQDARGHEDGSPMQTLCAPGHQNWERKALSVLSPVQTGVSKKAKKRRSQPQKPGVSQAARYETADGHVPWRRSERISGLSKHKQRFGPERMPLPPQRVSKATSSVLNNSIQSRLPLCLDLTGLNEKMEGIELFEF
ncbi:hypothetical protein MMC07_004073 [Pseudocyphellaria aurata]|nr:hypothetical protein [Pseudocyphellaria aurata]